MIVARVDGENLVVLCGIGRIEVVAADGEALQADAEHLALDAVLHHGLLLREDLVERLLEQTAVEGVVDGNIFAAVVHPEVHDAGVALSLTHGVGDVAAALGVLDPELADALVGIGQRERAALGMGEGRGVEVEQRARLLAPIDPRLEILHGDFVAIHSLALEIAVDLVQIEAVAAGDEALGLEHVGTQLVDVAGGAGKVAGGLDAAAHVAGQHLEAVYVVGLPAVHGEVEVLKKSQSGLGVHTDLGIALFGYGVGLGDKF